MLEERPQSVPDAEAIPGFLGTNVMSGTVAFFLFVSPTLARSLSEACGVPSTCSRRVIDGEGVFSRSTGAGELAGVHS